MRKATGARPAPSPRRGGPFKPAAQLVSARVRGVAEKRGFARSEVLTRWRDIVGPEMAAKAQPVKVSYAKAGMGATLVLFAKGAAAHEIEMQADLIRQKVNGCFGYNAISRIRLTQTAPSTGLAEDLASYGPPPPAPITPYAANAAAPVENQDLRNALSQLASNVMRRNTET